MDLIPFLFTSAEDTRVKQIEKELKKINYVTVLIQSDNMNLAKARLLLDGVISLELPGVDPLHYITADAKLVHDVAFENGIVSFNTLHEDEKDALKSCLNYNLFADCWFCHVLFYDILHE